MKPKTIAILLVLTAGTVTAAVIARGGRERAGAGSAESGQLLFPALAARVNEVAALKLVKGAETFEVARGDKGWGLTSRGGYPVELENVKKAILAVSRLEIVEVKTSKAERYGELGLQEPGSEGADSAQLTLADKSGNAMASVIVGHSSFSGAKPTLYVRRAGEAQSYCCKGELTLDTAATRWIKADVLKLDRERTRAVEIDHPDGQVCAIEKSKPEDADFAVRDVPQGRELLSSSTAATLGTALTWLNVDDVKPAAEVDFSAAPGPKSVFKCFDGLVVAVETTEVDGKTWARFAASFEEPPPPVAPEAPASEAPAAGAAPDESAAPQAAPAAAVAAATEPKAAAPAPKIKSPDDVKKEVEELNARLGGWAYQIPSYKAGTFKKRTEEFLKPLPAPEAPAAEAPAPPADGTTPPGGG